MRTIDSFTRHTASFKVLQWMSPRKKKIRQSVNKLMLCIRSGKSQIQMRRLRAKYRKFVAHLWSEYTENQRCQRIGWKCASFITKKKCRIELRTILFVLVAVRCVCLGVNIKNLGCMPFVMVVVEVLMILLMMSKLLAAILYRKMYLTKNLCLKRKQIGRIGTFVAELSVETGRSFRLFEQRY